MVELPGLGLRRRIHLEYFGQPDSVHVCHLPPSIRTKAMAYVRQLRDLHLAFLLHCSVR